MTYREHFERLSLEYELASKEFHRFRGRLSKTRQHRSGKLSSYALAKYRFEETSKSYWAFLNFWVSHKLNPMDEIGTIHLANKIYSVKSGKWVEPSEFHISN